MDFGGQDETPRDREVVPDGSRARYPAERMTVRVRGWLSNESINLGGTADSLIRPEAK